MCIRDRDMSLAQEMVEQEKIAKDELMKHEERNNLYAYPVSYTHLDVYKRQVLT